MFTAPSRQWQQARVLDTTLRYQPEVDQPYFNQITRPESLQAPQWPGPLANLAQRTPSGASWRPGTPAVWQKPRSGTQNPRSFRGKHAPNVTEQRAEPPTSSSFLMPTPTCPIVRMLRTYQHLTRGFCNAAGEASADAGSPAARRPSPVKAFCRRAEL
jgi:hypothetical protein